MKEIEEFQYSFDINRNNVANKNEANKIFAHNYLHLLGKANYIDIIHRTIICNLFKIIFKQN